MTNHECMEEEYDCTGKLCGSISGEIKMNCDCPPQITYHTELVPVAPNIETDTIQAQAQNYLDINPGVLLTQILDVGQNGWVLVLMVPDP